MIDLCSFILTSEVDAVEEESSIQNTLSPANSEHQKLQLAVGIFLMLQLTLSRLV